MYCIHCGKEVPEGAAYCITCGKPCFTASSEREKQRPEESDVTVDDLSLNIPIRSNIWLLRILLIATDICLFLPFINYRSGIGSFNLDTYNAFGCVFEERNTFIWWDEITGGSLWIIILCVVLSSIAMTVASLFIVPKRSKFNYIFLNCLSIPAALLILCMVVWLGIFSGWAMENGAPAFVPAYGCWVVLILQIICNVAIWPDIKARWRSVKVMIQHY